MITYSIIQKSQLEGTSRLDAEYYQPEYLSKVKNLSRFPTVKLQNIAYITDGEHGSPIFDETSGIKYFSAQHVKDCLIDPSEAKYISKIIDSRNKRSRLQAGDILLSTVGTIGFAGLVTKELLPANIDRHVARIALKENTLQPEFLIAFLNSSYGKFQTLRESTGNVQLNLFIDKIKELKVPKKNNTEIAKLVQLALDQIDNSYNLYFQAEKLLLKELGLANIAFEEESSYAVRFTDTISAKRMDPEYFQPKYEKLINVLKNKKTAPLNEIVEIIKPNFNPLSKPDSIFNYVELANINSSLGLINSYSKLLGKELPSRAKLMLKSGDILVSSIEGSLDKVCLVKDHQNSYVASNGFFQLRSKQLLPESLLVIAKSIVLQMQLKQRCSGTILSAVSPDSLNNIILPILPIDKQKEIADLVKKSHEARQRSKELIEEAKRKVEEMIEKGGDL